MGNQVDGALNNRVVYSKISPCQGQTLPIALPVGRQWVMRLYLESFQVSRLYSGGEWFGAEGWLSIRLNSPRVEGITRTFGWKADRPRMPHRSAHTPYELRTPEKFRRQLLYYGPGDILSYKIFVVESDESDRKAVRRVKAATEVLAGLASKLPPPYNLSGDALKVVSAASNVIEMHIDDDIEMESVGTLPAFEAIQHDLLLDADRMFSAGTFSIQQSRRDLGARPDPRAELAAGEIAKSVTFRIEFDQIPITPQEINLRISLTRVNIPNQMLENKILGIRMNRHRNLVLNLKLGVANSSIPYSLEVPVINGRATAARVASIDPYNGVLVFDGKWSITTEFFYEVSLRLGKRGRVWLSDKLHFQARDLEAERKRYEALAESTTKLIDSSLSTAKKEKEAKLKKAIEAAVGDDRARLEAKLAALSTREWAPVNILRAGVTELPGIINELIPDDKTLRVESGSFYLEPLRPTNEENLQSIPLERWAENSVVIYLVPNANLDANQRLNSIQYTRPDPNIFYLELLFKRGQIAPLPEHAVALPEHPVEIHLSSSESTSSEDPVAIHLSTSSSSS